MEILIYSLLLVIITEWLIIKGYHYYKLTWPERYFGPDDKANIFISTSPLYYVIFRLLPVFIAILVTHGVFYKVSIVDQNPLRIYHPFVLGLVTALLYSLATDGRVILDLLIKSSNVEVFINKTTQYFIHILAIPLMTIIGGAAGYTATLAEVRRFLPDLYGLVDNIWAAFITIILFFAVKNFINRPKEVNVDEVINKSASKIIPATYSLIEELSRKHNADSILVKSICIAENIQRPKWIRFLENMFGRLKPSGTYGIMQVASKKPIGDEQSIKIAVEKYFINTESMDFSQKMKTVEAYNSNDKYISLIEAVYNFITPTA